MTEISSTELKQNTRKVLQQLRDKPSEPVMVCTYNEPKVVMISYEVWKDEFARSKKPTLKDLKKYMVGAGKKIDSAKFIRELRNEG